jgi:pyruvate-formate lyase-activating enzyme
VLTALYAGPNGEIFDAPGYGAVASAGGTWAILKPQDMIPLPEGADLMFLPGRSALMAKNGHVEAPAGDLLAVAAILPAGYTRTHLPAFARQQDAPVLPLYGYTAAAFYRGEIYVAAVNSDDNAKWHPFKYNTPDLRKKVVKVQKDLPANRIVRQLGNCSLKWHCCTAQNLFYRRWEAGIPTSPACNANCFGCISLQPAECCPSPQSRIDFSPTPEEIAEVGAYHLSGAPEAIVSFGQGCEGEPALAADNIAAGIKSMRKATARGVINMNTNAGYTDGIKTITDAGLDMMRVSMISAVPATYQAYYRGNYNLAQVKESVMYAKRRGVFVSLNMLLFPGFNDRPEEVGAWEELIAETGIDMVQLRNLNIDPEAFLAAMPQPGGRPLGVRQFVARLEKKFPRLAVGSFSRYIKDETN